MHNPNATRANIMGGSVAGMHKTILPLASGPTPPNRCTQQQQRPQQCLCLLPSWRYGLATTNPSRTVWRNATGQWHLPPATDHGHAGVSTWPRNDDECWTALAGHWNYADDANGPTADSGTHVNEPLCPQPTAQPDSGVFLMGRGR
jgi:hypothetical protein